MENFTVVVVPPGSNHGLELTPELNSVSFTTMAFGGFGSLTCTIPLAQVHGGLNRVPKLSHMALYHGSSLLWEGRIEDHDLDILGQQIGLTGFGYQRLLDGVSLKRVWIMRAIPWQLVTDLEGTGKWFDPQTWYASAIGRFDPTDLSRVGVLLSAQDNAPASVGQAHGAWLWTDAGMSVLKFDEIKNGNDPINTQVFDSPDGSTWTSRYDANTAASETARSVTLGSNVQYIRLISYFNTAVQGANVAAEYDNIRILHAVTTEDVSGVNAGSFYPATLLADILGQIPGLTAGKIDNDTSFSIPNLSRINRDKARSVIEEISSYYLRRWGVWEDRRFDWKAVTLDEAQWVLTLDQLSGLNITSSVDNTIKTVYLAYQDAGSGLAKEVTATASDRRNPWVTGGEQKDELMQAPVSMTAASAQQLVNRIITDHGSIPAVRGRAKLNAWAPVENSVGVPRPACYIRAGQNVVIPELPKDDYLRPGRDGQTMFNVTGTSLDMEDGSITLELDGYSRTADILISRIATATRSLTG